MVKALVFWSHLLKMSLKASISQKGVFLTECFLIIANNLLFFSLWGIFFQRFQDIGNWTFQDMTALIAVGSGAFGLAQISFGGIKKISYLILTGELDSFIIQPQNILLHVAGSKSFAKGWGHLMTGILLTLFGGFATPLTMPLAFFCMLLASCIFASVGVIAYSLPFWFGSIESVSKKYYESLLLFSMYPTNIYSGILKTIMFTLIPAGLIGSIPVELLRHFSIFNLLLLIGSSVSFIALAFFIFNAGLKRYESGNQFGLRS